MKVGDLVRYRHHYHRGLFVVTLADQRYQNLWIEMISLKNGKRYVELFSSMEIFHEKKLDKSSDRVNG